MLRLASFIGSIPSSWLEAQLRQLGLDTYVQNFTFKYPVGILKGHVSYQFMSAVIVVLRDCWVAW